MLIAEMSYYDTILTIDGFVCLKMSTAKFSEAIGKARPGPLACEGRTLRQARTTSNDVQQQQACCITAHDVVRCI